MNTSNHVSESQIIATGRRDPPSGTVRRLGFPRLGIDTDCMLGALQANVAWGGSVTVRSVGMSEPGPSSATPQVRRILLGLSLGLLVAMSLLVLQPFLAPMVWAAILAFTSWPLYRRLRRPLRRSNNAAAFLMTLLMCCVVVLPLFWLVILLKSELVESYGTLAAYFKQGPHPLPTVIRDIPWLNNLVQEGLDRYASDPDELRREALSLLQSWARELAGVLGNIGRNLGKLLVTMLTLFFLFESLVLGARSSSAY
jgi:predicted PurR-regulated permease PerM